MITRPSAATFALRVILPAFIAQNLSMGIAYGSFGPLLAATETHFGITRAYAALGMSMLYVALAGLSPLVGWLMQKTSLRLTMIGGAVLSIVGYAGLALTPSFELALALYPLTGAGVCILGILGPVTLISRWLDTGRAKTLALVNLPIMISLMPFLVGTFLPQFGRSFLLLMMAASFVLLIPLLWFMLDKPADETTASGEKSGAEAAPSSSEDRVLSTMEILKNPPFWLLTIGIGVMAGASSAFMVHMVPFAMGRDLTLQSASLLLSESTITGIAGLMLFGWAADRFGPGIALVVSCFLTGVLWLALFPSSGAALFILSGFMGMVMVPIPTLHGVTMGTIFTTTNVSRAMGLGFAIKLPFLVGFAPLVGLIYERSGGYQMAFLFNAILMFLAVIVFLMMMYMVRHGRLKAANLAPIQAV